MLNKVSLTCVDGVLHIEFAIITVVIEFSVALVVVFVLLQWFTHFTVYMQAYVPLTFVIVVLLFESPATGVANSEQRFAHNRHHEFPDFL